MYQTETQLYEEDANGGKYKSFFSLEDMDYYDTQGTSSDLKITKTDSYIYGKNKLWISLSKVAMTGTNSYYYALLVDGYVWAEGKHSSTIWFSTKSVNFNVTSEPISLERSV